MLGLLWMDDSEATVAKKVEDAAQRYRVRLGKAPTLCYANPADVPESLIVKGIRVEPRRNILRHHFLVGCDAAAEKKPTAKAAEKGARAAEAREWGMVA